MGISWISRSELTTNKMKFFIIAATVVAGVIADADPQLLLGGAALPYAAVGSAVVATPPASPASTVKTAPVIASAVLPAAPLVAHAAPVVAHAALPAVSYGGLGLGYAGLGYHGLGLYGRKKREADPGLLLANSGANALPIATIPDLATAGYAPGASGALGGQAPVAAVAAVAPAAPVVHAALPAAVGYAGLGYGYGLGHAGLGYAGLGYGGLGYAGLGVYGRKKREAGLVSSLPVVSLPAAATAGYAVGGSGAIGGQEPIAAIAAAPAVLPAAVGYAGLGHVGLGYAGLGHVGLGYTGLGLAGVPYIG